MVKNNCSFGYDPILSGKSIAQTIFVRPVRKFRNPHLNYDDV